VRRVALTVVALALMGVLVPGALANVRVAVRPCPTTYAVPGDRQKPPTKASLALTAFAAQKLVAWAGGGTPIVLAPHGFACKALVGADGSAHVQLAPPGAARSGPAVDVEVEGACVGCITAMACGLFPAAEQAMGYPCTTKLPTRERVAQLLPTVRAFSDPAGVKGSGSPSGGRLPAVGAVVFVPERSAFAARVTCTLEKADAGSCQPIIADFLSRIGRR
jgi:hypothetical protein